MRRLLAAAGALALVGIATPALATPTPNTAIAQCGPGTGITFKGSLIRTVKSTPGGPANEISGQELFVISCQPISGSVTIQLQFRSGNTWVNAGDHARFNFPTTDRGFGLAVGPYYCQGTKTSWRIAIFSSGVTGVGTPWGPSTDFDPLIGGSSGKYFNCG